MKLPSTLGSTALILSLLATASAKPLKVFILAGQSNMEGHARVETFDYIGDDPATAPLLKKMRNQDGTPHIADGAWITYFTGKGENNGEGFGKLTTGYGSRGNPAEDGGKIGPEFTFGITMDETFEEPVLIIKTAWGGKSLFYDFRPPSADVYPRSEKDIEKDRNPESNSGHYYRLITPEEAAMRERGASNAGYHYLGCGKTFAVMGKAFAEAILAMQK